MPDSIEIDKITFTDLPLKACNDLVNNETHLSTIKLFTPQRTFEDESPAENSEQNDEVEHLNQHTDKIISSQENNRQLSDRGIRRVKKKGKPIPQTCEKCEKHMLSRKGLRLHKLKEHGQKLQFKCVFCGIEFDFVRSLLRHHNSEHRQSDGRFCCAVCSRGYSDYQCFVTHIKTHINNYEEEEMEKYSESCDDKLKDDKSLAVLQNLAHTIYDKTKKKKLKCQEKNFICDFCGKRFTFHCLLRDHINLHTGAKPHLCSGCGKAFSLKSTLKQHSKTHGDVRPYQCSECPSGFFARGDLNKHARKHTGERPFICEVCSERFSRSSHLRVHRRLHTGERPFECEECGRAFTKRGDLVRHWRVHTGELPYLCQVCGKAFRQSTQCANHIKSHHPETHVPVVNHPNPLPYSEPCIGHGGNVRLIRSQN